MDDQPTRTTTAATADLFGLIEADLLRVLRWRARRGDPRSPKPGRPRAPRRTSAGPRDRSAGTKMNVAPTLTPYRPKPD